jgi:hypothetical protein
MKIFDPDGFNTAFEKSLDNCIYITTHIHACPGPFSGPERRAPVIPTAGTAFDIGNDQDALEVATHPKTSPLCTMNVTQAPT